MIPEVVVWTAATLLNPQMYVVGLRGWGRSSCDPIIRRIYQEEYTAMYFWCSLKEVIDN